MKVKYANRIYTVSEIKETGGITWYGIEDEPNHIDWVHDVEIIDTREEEIYNAMGDAEWKHIDGTKDIELFDMGFKEGAEWADSHPHWVSVEDELPPQNEAYLAYWQHLGVTKYRYVKAGAKVSRTFSAHITHWMPLPAPPTCSEIPNYSKKGE